MSQHGLLQVIEHAGMWAVAYSNGAIVKDGFTNEQGLVHPGSHQPRQGRLSAWVAPKAE
jgi:hypothetical protein